MGHPGSGLAQPDVAILRLAQRGDERAFAVVVHAYERLVFTYVYRLVDDRRLAEDLTQDVFLKVYRGLPGFTGSCAFTTWLFQIAKNRVVDELRAIERRPPALSIDDVTMPALVEARFDHAEPIEALWVAVAALNVDLRTALLLRDIVGLSYAEIADSLEITVATVKWRIHKAREGVQGALERGGLGFAAPSEPSTGNR